MTPDDLNARLAGHFPELVGIRFTHVTKDEVRAECPVRSELMAPNGFLHAGAVVTLADTCAGFACVVNLPAEANGFTTVELKSNFIGTARDGMLDCVATPAHRGGTTQVWDAVVTHRETGRRMALFRCTQMVLYPRT